MWTLCQIVPPLAKKSRWKSPWHCGRLLAKLPTRRQCGGRRLVVMVVVSIRRVKTRRTKLLVRLDRRRRQNGREKWLLVRRRPPKLRSCSWLPLVSHGPKLMSRLILFAVPAPRKGNCRRRKIVTRWPNRLATPCRNTRKG